MVKTNKGMMGGIGVLFFSRSSVYMNADLLAVTTNGYFFLSRPCYIEMSRLGLKMSNYMYMIITY